MMEEIELNGKQSRLPLFRKQFNCSFLQFSQHTFQHLLRFKLTPAHFLCQTVREEVRLQRIIFLKSHYEITYQDSLSQWKQATSQAHAKNTFETQKTFTTTTNYLH